MDAVTLEVVEEGFTNDDWTGDFSLHFLPEDPDSISMYIRQRGCEYYQFWLHGQIKNGMTIRRIDIDSYATDSCPGGGWDDLFELTDIVSEGTVTYEYSRGLDTDTTVTITFNDVWIYTTSPDPAGYPRLIGIRLNGTYSGPTDRGHCA